MTVLSLCSNDQIAVNALMHAGDPGKGPLCSKGYTWGWGMGLGFEKPSVGVGVGSEKASWGEEGRLAPDPSNQLCI